MMASRRKTECAPTQGKQFKAPRGAGALQASRALARWRHRQRVKQLKEREE